MQFKQKIMKQIISLSIVSIAFDTAEMRRMNRDLGINKRGPSVRESIPIADCLTLHPLLVPDFPIAGTRWNVETSASTGQS